MSSIEESVEVEVPVRVAYNQWTQFEEFPRFMEGVESIRQIDDTNTHWVTEIAGQKREFDATITEQSPDERIAWTTTEGPRQAGVVTFHHLAEGRSKVMLQLEFEPSGLVEDAGDLLGLVGRRAKGDLKRFKDLVESRGSESGAWRGDVPGPSTS